MIRMNAAPLDCLIRPAGEDWSRSREAVGIRRLVAARESILDDTRAAYRLKNCSVRRKLPKVILSPRTKSRLARMLPAKVDCTELLWPLAMSRTQAISNVMLLVEGG